MADSPISIGEELAMGTLIALIRRGVLSAADILDMDLSDAARDAATNALLEAATPPDGGMRMGGARPFAVINGRSE